MRSYPVYIQSPFSSSFCLSKMNAHQKGKEQMLQKVKTRRIQPETPRCCPGIPTQTPSPPKIEQSKII